MTPTRGAERTAVIWDALDPILAVPGLDVLDIGGGTGGFAVTVAQLGHRVRVVDPSPDALAALDRRAREVGAEVTGVQGDLSDLQVEPGSVDLVMCHGVLEFVSDPAADLRALGLALRDGGQLSVAVAQRHSAVIAKAMAGHFTDALALVDQTAPSGRTGRRFTAAELLDTVVDAGLVPGDIRGVRVFADLVPSAILDTEPQGTSALAELERAVAARSEFWPLAAQLHLIASRPEATEI